MNNVHRKWDEKIISNMVTKVVINCCVGKMSSGEQAECKRVLGDITGQVPALRRCKTSVSNFKIRKGMPIGYVVTLRRDTAINFLKKIIWIVWPSMPHFRGIGKKCICEKTINFGISEISGFPEIRSSTIVKGFDVSISVQGDPKLLALGLCLPIINN